MSEFKIEKGVPMPDNRNYGATRYPFRQMEVGDSLFVPGQTTATFSGVPGGWARRAGFKFACRTVEGGVRVWRVA